MQPMLLLIFNFLYLLFMYHSNKTFKTPISLSELIIQKLGKKRAIVNGLCFCSRCHINCSHSKWQQHQRMEDQKLQPAVKI